MQSMGPKEDHTYSSAKAAAARSASPASDCASSSSDPEIPAFPGEENEVPDTRLGEVSSALQ